MCNVTHASHKHTIKNDKNKFSMGLNSGSILYVWIC